MEEQPYSCKGWECGKSELLFDGEEIDAVINTCSPSCSIDAKYLAAGNISELENGDFKDKVALLYGELTQEVLASKNNKVYNPDKYKRIVELMEQKNPLAIVTVSHRIVNPNRHI